MRYVGNYFDMSKDAILNIKCHDNILWVNLMGMFMT